MIIYFLIDEILSKMAQMLPQDILISLLKDLKIKIKMNTK